MKKKFINGLLLAALFVGFTGSMVSCKDYDDEKVANLEGRLNDELTSLRDALAAQKAALEAQIANLSTSLEECKSTCAAFRQLVERTYLTIAEFNTFKDGLGNTYYTKAQVDARIAEELAKCYTKEEIDAIFAKYYTKEEIDNFFDNYFTKEEINSFFAKYYTKEEIDNFLSKYLTKEEIEASYYNKTTIDNMLKDYLTKEALAKSIADLLEKGDETLTAALNNFFLNDPVVEQYLKDGKGADIIKEHITNALIEVNNSISEAKSLAQEALTLAKENKISIGNLQNTLNENVQRLDNLIINLGEDVAKAQETANEALAQAAANSLLIAYLQDAYDEVENRVGNLEDNYDELKKELEEMKEKALADSLAADALHRQMLETISGLVTAIDKLGDLVQDVDCKELQTKLDEAVINIEKNTRALSKLVGSFENVMAKFITGIEINGTQNPMFGSFSLPVDMRSNVLVAFYGHLDDYGIQFPTDRPAYYALPDGQRLTAEDIEMIGGLENVAVTFAGNQDIVNSMDVNGTVTEGNAGKLYLTVNPTNRDFTDTEFKLVNSRNETSAIVLSDLAKSEDVLTFGFTRAGVAEQSENGFYEAKATLKPANLGNAESLKLDMSEVKGIWDDIRNYRDGINVTKIVSTACAGIATSVEANAVKTTWEDSLGVRSVLSQYAIAATAVKPLSFAFAKDYEYSRVPGLGFIEDVADRFIDRVASKFGNMRNYAISNVEFIAYDPSDLSVTVSLTLTNASGSKDETIVFTLSSIVTVEPDSFVYSTDDVAQLIADLNDFFDSMNTISVDSLASKIKQTISSFIDDINSRYGHYFNPNKFMQPLLLVKANGSFARLSETASYPARVNDTRLNLLPTSYNAEVLAPAFKKFIAVTNVTKGGLSAKGGDVDCKSVLDEANSQQNINEVIDGGYKGFIGFTGKVGYTYEILYTAVDYAGKVVVKKFYVMF